jgi:hypothetical protein
LGARRGETNIQKQSFELQKAEIWEEVLETISKLD